MNEYQREYLLICKQTPRFTIGDCAGGHRGDNRKKNRDVLIVPRKYLKRVLYTREYKKFFTADNFRPYLTSFQGNNFTDYINAVFVDVSKMNIITLNNKRALNILYFRVILSQGNTS